MFKLDKMNHKQLFFFPAKWCPMTGTKGAEAFQKVKEIFADGEEERPYHVIRLAYDISIEEAKDRVRAEAMEGLRKEEAGEIEDLLVYFDNIHIGVRQKFLEKYGFCLCKGGDCPKGTFYTWRKNYSTLYFHCGELIFPDESPWRVSSYPKVCYDFEYIQKERDYSTKYMEETTPDEDIHNPNEEDEEETVPLTDDDKEDVPPLTDDDTFEEQTEK